VLFLLGGQLALRPKADVFVKSPEFFLDKTLPHAPDGCCPHSQCYGNPLIAQAIISFKVIS
jgi:hypothetical protein